MKPELRAGDVIGSLGGNGLGVILAITDQQRAEQKRQSVEAAFAERPFMWTGKTICQEVKSAIHTFAKGDDGEKELRKLASEAIGTSTGR